MMKFKKYKIISTINLWGALASIAGLIISIVLIFNSSSAEKPDEYSVPERSLKTLTSINSSTSDTASILNVVKNNRGQIKPYDTSSKRFLLADPVTDAALRQIALLSKRQFDKLIDSAADILPEAAFRLRAQAYVLKGDIKKAYAEFNINNLKASGYPDNIQNGYYKGWNSLCIKKNILLITDRKGAQVASFALDKFIEGDLSYNWTLKQINCIRPLIYRYQANHPYCCLIKFLIEDYSPNDLYELIQLDLLSGDFARANLRLNMLRLIDWEASFTEIEFLSVIASLLQGDFASAKYFLYSGPYGNALRYGDAINSFMEMAANFDNAKFEEVAANFENSIIKYTAEPPFDLYDCIMDQPVLEKWLSS